ncbi:hypothetical protein PIB30_043672 [Stylosanthes scabra]|uniref:Disease resistance RPP13-like protein 1 n=1 Tax=Stylosanthes scabra TaxID=79078 RepID=A0ABU6ZEE3_9FABA|nr:hypothetical protein [Stylosanthes scabra]
MEVGGAFLSSFLSVLFDRLSDPQIINLIRGKKLSEKMIQKFKGTLNAAEALLNDAERRQIREGPVKIWLEDLKDALYEADDFLDEITTKAATQKDPPGNFLSRFLNMQDREMVARMEDVIGRLESIVNQKDTLGLKEIPMENMSWRTPSTSLVKESDIYGRDEDRKALVKLLLGDANDGDVSVIPIVGMGGIGKTTLAQLVYNDDQVQQKFKLKAWVCVGEEFNVLKVTTTVVENATSGSCNVNNLDSVQLHLKNELAGKEFLLVLDDLWSKNYDSWKCFLTPFQLGSARVKILVTTRDHRIASMVKTIPTHNLSLLDDNQCWSVFAKHAFLPADSRDLSALEEVGREIVKKCKGLPLVAQTLGGLLRTKDTVKEWNDVLKSEIWEFSQEESGVLPALRISYHYLPSHLKRCFVYCSLYPKDYKLDRDELVLLWMAEDLLQQAKRGICLEEVGCKYFDDLVARSFFQPSNNAYNKNSFVMHDLIHDLATFYGEKFFVRTFEPANAAKHDTKTRHLSYDSENSDSVPKMLEACDSLSHVRTLLKIKKGFYLEDILKIDHCHLLAQLKSSRVLFFSSFAIDSVPDSICELIHLRYLDLSGTLIVTLPESLNNLYNLQTLKLKRCSRLKKLPSRMQDLVNLRHLDIEDTCIEEMPQGMSKLKDLQFLSNYMVGKHEENGTGELGKLTHLHGSLRVEKLENVNNSGEASNAKMDEKTHLNRLDLIWSSLEESEVCDSQTEKDVLDRLRPHKDLKVLRIIGYRGTMFPDWVGHSSYHKMTNLELNGCRNCWVLPPSLGQLPSLEILSISGFDNLKKIDGEFYKGFRSLKYLSFENMGCWEEWESFECDDDDHAPFPQLEKLMIYNCPKLRGDLPTFLPSLKTLHISRCSELGCDLPRAPIIRELRIYGKQEARMRELSLSMLESLDVNGEHLVEYVFDAMTHTQPTSLTFLHISNCSSVVSLPGDSLPPSLRQLYIFDCKNVEFPMQHQQHHSLQRLGIHNSCDSLTSFAFPAFPNLIYLRIAGRENLTSLEELSQSQSLRRLSIERCPKLEKISLPASLNYLSISECPLLEGHIERKDPHIWPSISHVPQIYVDGKTIRNESTS